MAQTRDPITDVLEFFNNVYEHTSFEDTTTADEVFSDIHQTLPVLAKSSDGLKVIRFGAPQAVRASDETGFRDVIKIIWRMTKTMSGSPMHRLSLFILGTGTVCGALRHSSTSNPQAKDWIGSVEKWLGTQLTIGGKGCTGEGEGSVQDRLQRFMSTPYLHDFD